MIRETIEATIRHVAADHNKVLPELRDETRLEDTGLDSLCLAVIVALLEDTLGIDPLHALDDGTFPVTVGEFMELYEGVAA
jgi:hypothetical protein